MMGMQRAWVSYFDVGGDDGCLQFKQGVERGERIWMDPLYDIPAQISAKSNCKRFSQKKDN